MGSGPNRRFPGSDYTPGSNRGPNKGTGTHRSTSRSRGERAFTSFLVHITKGAGGRSRWVIIVYATASKTWLKTGHCREGSYLRGTGAALTAIRFTPNDWRPTIGELEGSSPTVTGTRPARAAVTFQEAPAQVPEKPKRQWGKLVWAAIRVFWGFFRCPRGRWNMAWMVFFEPINRKKMVSQLYGGC